MTTSIQLSTATAMAHRRWAASLVACLVAVLLVAGLAGAPPAYAGQGAPNCFQDNEGVLRCTRRFYNGKSVSVQTAPGVYKTFNVSFDDTANYPISDLTKTYYIQGVAKATVSSQSLLPKISLATTILYEGPGVGGYIFVSELMEEPPVIGKNNVVLNTRNVLASSASHDYEVSFSEWPETTPPTGVRNTASATLVYGSVSQTIGTQERVSFVSVT